MKLFKKKDAGENDSPKTKNVRKPLASKAATIFLSSCILAGLIPFAITAFFLNNHYINDSNDQISKAAATYYSKLQANVVKSTLQQYYERLDSLSQEAGIIAAMSDKGEGHLDTLATFATTFKPAFPYGADLRFIPKDSIQNIETSGDFPIRYSGLDLIRRAERTNKPSSEATKVNDQWYIALASPIRQDDESKTILGTAYLVVKPTQIFKELNANNDRWGKTVLQQTFERSDPQAVITTGKGNQKSYSVTTPIENSIWSVIFTPSSRLLTQLGNTNDLLIYCILGCSLFFTITVLISYVRFSASLTKNVKQLGLYLEGILSGKSSLEEPVFSFPQLQHIMASIIALKPRKPSDPEYHSDETDPVDENSSLDEKSNLSNPMFQQDDILDIDMHDDDQDLLGLSGGEDDVLSGLDSEPDKPINDSDSKIFRAYDIRGVVDSELTDDYVVKIGQAIGSEALDQQQTSIIVGADGRLSSPSYTNCLIEGILSTGCNVINIGQVPSPVLYFATHTLETSSGVVITASHNPAEYNGFKIVINGRSVFDDAILNLKMRIDNNQFHSGQGSLSEADMIEEYIERITSDVALADSLKVVVDCGNGVAGNIAPQLFEELGCEVIPLHCEVDGNFPNHQPDPSELSNLDDLIAKVQEENADLGVALDGDGDRIGVVTASGKIILPDRLLMLFAKDIVSRNPGTDVLFDVKCTRRLNSVISSYGGRPVMWKTGHSFMKEKMIETGALLGGELSGHIFFKERWYGFDDGLYSAARLMEILTVRDQDIDSVFGAFPIDISTPEIRVPMADESKFNFIELLRAKGDFGEGKITSIDGIRVDFSDGWGLVRASNTTPALTLRYEAENEEALERIKKIFKSQMLLVDSTLVLTQ